MVCKFDNIILMFQKRIVVSKRRCSLVQQTNYRESYLSNATSSNTTHLSNHCGFFFLLLRLFMCWINLISIGCLVMHKILLQPWAWNFIFFKQFDWKWFGNCWVGFAASNVKKESVYGLGFSSFHSQGNMKNMFSLMLNLRFKSFV